MQFFRKVPISMINYLTGSIKEIHSQFIVVDIGNVGLAVAVPNAQVFKSGNKVTLYTHLHWNQEQGPSLYGFNSALEKAVFLLVISCSGIGPKIALAVLADLGATKFLQAVQTGNDSMLSKVTGIGAKKAEQIAVQLKHKVAKLIESGIDLGDVKDLTQWHEVVQVLESLHYSRMEVNRAMDHLKKLEDTSSVSFDMLLRKALTFLSK